MRRPLACLTPMRRRSCAEVGGQEAFQQLSGWAKANLDPAELADYNAVVDSGNKSAIRWALKAMQAKFTRANIF